MKRLLSIFLCAAILSVCVSCSDSRIRTKSEAGAYYLMFQTAIEKSGMIEKYAFLSLDSENCGLADEDLAILEDMIRDCSEKKGVEFITMSGLRLRRALRIVKGKNGEEFTNGCLLSFYGCGYREDEKGRYFTGNVSLWHADFDEIGGVKFVIRYDGGWYIDTEAENGGYDELVS